MPREALAKEDIYAAALILQKEGVEPNTINIRAKLGGRGSQTTIHKHLSTWRKLYGSSNTYDLDELNSQVTEQKGINKELTEELFKLQQLATNQADEIKLLRDKNLELQVSLYERDRVYSETTTQLQSQHQANQAAFEKAITMLAEQVSSINERAVRKLQEVGHSYDERILDAHLLVRELQQQLQMKGRDSDDVTDIANKTTTKQSSKAAK